MDIVTELKLKAEREYAKLDNKKIESELELEKIKKRAAELEQIILSFSGSYERLLQFQPFINGDAQCPRCWVVNGIHTSLNAGVASNPRNDLYECRVHSCKFFVEVKA